MERMCEYVDMSVVPVNHFAIEPYFGNFLDHVYEGEYEIRPYYNLVGANLVFARYLTNNFFKFSTYDFFTTPFSVMIAEINSLGVTSKAG